MPEADINMTIAQFETWMLYQRYEDAGEGVTCCRVPE
jgi:hypothetical protein